MTEEGSEPAGAPLYFSHPASLGHLTGVHPEGPARITAIERELEPRDYLGYERRLAPAATHEALCAVHAEEYVERVRTMTKGAGGFLDAFATTVAGPGSWPAAVHAAGGACALAEALLAGEADVGFSATRPPGHHAASDTTSGFCLFNNVAVAAAHALASLGAQRVFILDWDVHHGDGTHDIFRASNAVLYASIHQLGLFPGTGGMQDAGAREGEGFSINLPVPPGSDEEVWVSLLEHVIVPAATGFRPDLILISAGFDAHEDDLLGGCRLDSGSFAEMARHVRALGESVGAPVGAVLEGGYTPSAVGASVAATMEALAGDQEPDSIAPHYLTAQAASFVGHYWEL